MFEATVCPLCKARTNEWTPCVNYYILLFPSKGEEEGRIWVKFQSKCSSNQKVGYFRDIPTSSLSANFILLSYSIKHYRKCFCPTCVCPASFSITGFCNYIQTTGYISSLRLDYIGWVLLNWGTGAYIQGSFLSTCLSTLCCV